jgi:hypothetical protein
MRSLGKFDFHVGPHTFPGTHRCTRPTTFSLLLSLRYHVLAPISPRLALGTTPLTDLRRTLPTHPTGLRLHLQWEHIRRELSLRLVSAVASDTPITPALISRVNDAAATDPILANFLQLAASGRATSDQLKTLALLIQSLAYTPSSSAALGGVSASDALSVLSQLSGQTPSSTPGSSTPATPPATLAHSHPTHEHPTLAQSTDSAGFPAPKEFDLVLEFPERPYDRWLFPRVPVVCERKPSPGDIEAILLLVALPFPKQKPGIPRRLRLKAQIRHKKLCNSA